MKKIFFLALILSGALQVQAQQKLTVKCKVPDTGKYIQLAHYSVISSL
ncbi:MAG: hypothetical protein LRY55_02820 [Leadbetterella sp.]|nr:hypothetical protein [Leadbetterella sp.]